MRIQPVGGRNLEAAAEGDECALGDIQRAHSHLGDKIAIDVHVERGQSEHLLDMHIGSAGDMAQFVGDLLADYVVRLQIRTHYLNINRRGQSEVENLGDDVGWLEEEFHTGEAARQFLPQILNYFGCGTAALLAQSDQNFRVVGSDHTGIGVGQVDAGIGQADIVQNIRDLALRGIS